MASPILTLYEVQLQFLKIGQTKGISLHNAIKAFRKSYKRSFQA